MSAGYSIQVGPVVYEGWRRAPDTGAPRPFTLAEAFHEVEGCAGARILAPTGRVVLDNAGSMTVRGYELPQRARAARSHARRLREARRSVPCPHCGARCAVIGHTGFHGPDGCDLELFALGAS